MVQLMVPMVAANPAALMGKRAPVVAVTSHLKQDPVECVARSQKQEFLSRAVLLGAILSLIYPNAAPIEQWPCAGLELPQLQPSDKIRRRQIQQRSLTVRNAFSFVDEECCEFPRSPAWTSVGRRVTKNTAAQSVSHVQSAFCQYLTCPIGACLIGMRQAVNEGAYTAGPPEASARTSLSGGTTSPISSGAGPDSNGGCCCPQGPFIDS